MSRLFTEFYFKDQVEYPDHIPTSTVDISNCASDVKKLSSAIDRASYDEDEALSGVLTDLSKEADNISSDVDNIIGGEDYYNYSQELENLLEQQLTGLWELEDYFEDIGISLAAEQIRESCGYRSKYYSSKTILNDYIFRHSTKLFDAFPDARFCVSLDKFNVIVEEKTKTCFRIEEGGWQRLAVAEPKEPELRAFQDYYNPTLNEIILFELEFNKEYPLWKMIEFYKPELLKQE